MDGTERPVQRSQDAEQQKAHYSGKKKRYTRKHITVSSRKKRVLILSRTRPGTVHDQRQLDEAGIVEFIPDAIAIEGDLGFQGLQKEFVNIRLTPKEAEGQSLEWRATAREPRIESSTGSV